MTDRSEIATEPDLAELNASDACNALAQLGIGRVEDRVILGLRPVVSRAATVIGRARTMQVGVVRDRERRSGQADSALHLGAYDSIEPGEVLLIAVTGTAPCAVLGGLVAMKASHRGAAAVIVDGFVRDTNELLTFGMPVWSRGRSPVPMGHCGFSVLSRDQPVNVGSAEVHCGDLLIADADGIVAVKSDEIAEVAAACERIREREKEMVAQVQAGSPLSEIIGPS